MPCLTQTFSKALACVSSPGYLSYHVFVVTANILKIDIIEE